MITGLGRVAVCALLVATSGCVSTPRTDRLLVFAAASLTTPFTEIGSRFTAANPGTVVEFFFAGSADLLSQLTQGAEADVFAHLPALADDNDRRCAVVESESPEIANLLLGRERPALKTDHDRHEHAR